MRTGIQVFVIVLVGIAFALPAQGQLVVQPGQNLNHSCNGEPIRIDAVDGQSRVTLTGNTPSLTIRRINGQSIVDASGLQADRIEITEEINGQSLLILKGEAAEVRINKIDGQSTVDASGLSAGNVSIVDKIDGQSDLVSGARTLNVNLVNGQSVIVSRVSAGGRIRVESMDGQSRVLWTGSDDVQASAGATGGRSRMIRLKGR